MNAALARMEGRTKGSEEKALALYETLLTAPESLRFERLTLRQLAINGISAMLQSGGRGIYAQREQEAARHAIEPLPGSVYRDSLIELAAFSVTRRI